jgi:uncharacterized YigZ family protein
MDSDTYKTIKSPAVGLYKDKGSRFVSIALPFSDPEELKIVIDNIRKEHHEAKHHCYAYMIGYGRTLWRANDGGEPSGTAGRPILGQINSYVLTNILIVVSRYFGGTLLGVSGLINAYRTAAASSIQNAQLVEMTLQEYYKITYPYISMNDVMRVLKEENVGQTAQSFEIECSILLNIRVSQKQKVLSRLSGINGLKYTYLDTH